MESSSHSNNSFTFTNPTASASLSLNSNVASYSVTGTDAYHKFAVGGSDVMSVVSGKIGVGTTSPSQALDVVGSIKASGDLVIGSTSVSASELSVIDTVTPGTASAGKAVVLDSNKSITGVTSIDTASLTVNGTPFTGGGGSSLVAGTTGVATASAATILDSTKSLYGLNNLEINSQSITSRSSYTNNSVGGFNWRRVNAGNVNAWKSVCYAPDKNLFVAISSTHVMRSSDGITWTTSSHGTNQGWSSIAYNPDVGRFVAVSSNGTSRVMYSSDAITWTSVAASPTIDDGNWNSVCAGTGTTKFVAVGSGANASKVIYSTDGITWTRGTYTAENAWFAVCWSPELSLFVATSATGTNDRVMTSPTGATWTTRTSAADNAWIAVCWSPTLQLFVAVANNGAPSVPNANTLAMTSSDGITWSARPTPSSFWQSVCWSSELGLFVAVATVSSIAASPIMTSTDGFSWTPLNTNAQYASWTSVCWAGQIATFVAVSQSDMNNSSGTKSTSNVMISIHTNTLTLSNKRNGKNFMTVNKSGGLQGITSKRASYINYGNSVSLSNAKSMVLNTNSVEYGDAGTIWKARLNSFAAAIFGICWSSELGIFVAVGVNGTNTSINPPNGVTGNCSVSSDGINWTIRPMPTVNRYESVCWSPELSLFVAVHNSAGSPTTQRVATSPDGFNWTARTSADDSATANWKSVCWSPELGLFVAVATSTVKVMTSTDGISWTARTISDTTFAGKSVCWSAELGLFVVVAEQGTGARSAVSYDGINWVTRTTAADTTSWNSVCWSPSLKKFVAVGSGSTTRVMTSSDGLSWGAATAFDGTPVTNAWQSVCWAEELGIFIAVGSSTTASGIPTLIMTSHDGSAWFGREATGYTTSNVMYAVCWAPEIDTLVAAANSLNALTSTHSPSVKMITSAGVSSEYMNSSGLLNYDVMSSGSNRGFSFNINETAKHISSASSSLLLLNRLGMNHYCYDDTAKNFFNVLTTSSQQFRYLTKDGGDLKLSSSSSNPGSCNLDLVGSSIMNTKLSIVAPGNSTFTASLDLLKNASFGGGATFTDWRISNNNSNLTISSAVSNSTTERIRLTNAGNLALGNTSPLSILHITTAAGANATTGVLGFTHSNTDNSIRFQTTMYSDRIGIGTFTNHPLTFITNNTQVMTITGSAVSMTGSLTVPSASITTLTLGGTQVTATATELNYLAGVSLGSVTASKALVVDSNRSLSGLGNLTLVNTANANSALLSVTGGTTPNMTFTGHTTNNNNVHFDIIGYGTSYPHLRLIRVAATAGSTTFGADAQTDWAISNNGSSNFEILSQNNTTTATRFAITAAGSIGVNTTSPNGRMHVRAGTGTAQTTDNSWYIAQTWDNSASGVRCDMQLSTTDLAATIGTFSNHPFRIQTNNTTRMVISNDGNVGINNATPAYYLDVAGSKSYGLPATSFAYYNSTQTNGTASGNVNISARFGAPIAVDSAVYVTSDRRLKQDVEQIDAEYAKQFITNTAPVRFRYKKNSESLHFGYIAQDVYKAGYDDLIKLVYDGEAEANEEEDGFRNPKDFKFMMKYEEVIPLLAKNVKMLYEENDNLKAQNQSLMSHIENMNMRLEELSAAIQELQKNNQ